MFAKLINPFTKKAYIRDDGEDLLRGIKVNPEVEKLYRKYQGKCERYLQSLPPQDTSASEYYIYAWHSKVEPKRYFYVGKGTGERWKHILSEIRQVESGKKKNARFSQYKVMQDSRGIECEFLLSGLTEFESLIAEECVKLEMCDRGEKLLNIEGIPDDKISANGWRHHDSNTPNIENDQFYREYENDYGDPKFDNIRQADLLKAWFYPFFISNQEEFQKQKQLASNYIISHGGKVYDAHRPSAKTRCIIVSGTLEYATYANYRKEGKKVYSITDVLKFIPEDIDMTVDLSLTPAKRSFAEKEGEIVEYIKNIFVSGLKVNPKQISVSRYQDEVYISIGKSPAGRGAVFLKVYKKRPGGYIAIPLDEAGDLRPKLTHITSWKGNFEFTELTDLDELRPFFLLQCDKGVRGMLLDRIM